MFGLSTLNLALIGGLVLSVGAGAGIVYNLVSERAVQKIQLQQQKLIAEADRAQYERVVTGLQRTAQEERRRAGDLSQLKDAIHATANSRACLAVPAGRAFMRVMRQQRGNSDTAKEVASKFVVVP